MIAILAQVDSQAEACEFLRTELSARGQAALLFDMGCQAAPACCADVSRQDIAQAGSAAKPAASSAAGQQLQGAREILAAGVEAGQLSGVLCLGSSAAADAFADALINLPVELAKLLILTPAGSPLPALLERTGLTLMLADAELNELGLRSKRTLIRAAACLSAMLKSPPPDGLPSGPAPDGPAPRESV